MRTIDIGEEKRFAPADQETPVLAWIDLDRLVIDDEYQRPLGKSNWTQIRLIAKGFRWSRFTPIMVAPTEDGRFAVIDGQHRVHAAALCEFTKVPAMIVKMPRKEQASSFSFVNGNVTQVTVFHLYKAALAAGEGWAVRCSTAVQRADCRLMTSNSSTNSKKSGEVYAIGLIRGLIEKGRDQAVTAGLAALRAHDQSGRVPLYSAMILRPWLTALAEVEDLERIDLAAFLRAHNPFHVVDRVHRLIETDDHYKGRAAAALERQAFQLLLKRFERIKEVC